MARFPGGEMTGNRVGSRFGGSYVCSLSLTSESILSV